MNKLIKLVISSVLLAGMSMSAHSFEFDDTKLYAGGGLGYNSLDLSGFDSAIGFQVFAGYDLREDVKINDKIKMLVEVGFTNSGTFSFSNCTFFCGLVETSSKGLWTNAVFDYAVDEKISGLARIGLDIGDDNGIMFGVGGGYKVNEKVTARLEYVIRPNYSSLQANAVYSF